MLYASCNLKVKHNYSLVESAFTVVVSRSIVPEDLRSGCVDKIGRYAVEVISKLHARKLIREQVYHYTAYQERLHIFWEIAV